MHINNGVYIPSKKVQLELPSHWNAWFTHLRIIAEDDRLWGMIDPNQEEQLTDKLSEPAWPTINSAIQELPRYQEIAPDIRLPDAHSILHVEYSIKQAQYADIKSRTYAVLGWISSTVNPSIYLSIRHHLWEKHNGDFTLRQLVKEIQREFAPFQWSYGTPMRQGSPRRNKPRRSRGSRVPHSST
ncbi:hypothetical protein X797_003207 [Metarhizium robertsii]|uniref:Uncharacterized protein n=1 Tax=Metarhizium robertsii TaxID=568076 RepID=A0A0A1UZF3_9HYPO|nr:hypothetical protein X797_003207 [Metarhizium robertsii]